MAILPLEILPRFPLQTILRSKSLNKFFHDYISSKKFINRHLHQPVSSKTSRHVLVLTAVRDGQNCLYLVDVDDMPDYSPRPRYLSLPPPLTTGKLTVVGSCHGLLCLNMERYVNNYNCETVNWLILNPLTGTLSKTISMCYETPVQFCSGFGYDSLNDDYKLVVVEYYNIRCMENDYDDTNSAGRKVRVYSMKTGSWSLVECTLIGESEARLPKTESKCVVVGNHLMHCLLRHAFELKRSIVCFNLESRRWAADVALPNYDAKQYYHRFVELGVVNGCLSLSCYRYDGYFNVWIMKEYGVEESWTEFSVELPENCRHYSIFPVEKGSSALEEILFTKKKDGRQQSQGGNETYVVYNTRDKTSREIELRSVPCSNLTVQSFCLGSLVTGFGAATTDSRRAIREELIFA